MCQSGITVQRFSHCVRQNNISCTFPQYFYIPTFKEPRNRFQGINSASLCSLASQYDKPIPARILAQEKGEPTQLF